MHVAKMKLSVMTEKRKLEWLTVDIPQPALGMLLVKLEYVGVCGSDLHFYSDGQLGNWVPDGPLTLGHEAGGVVAGVGAGVSGFQPGDRVALEPGVPCGKCGFCKRGLYNLCEHMSFMAIPGERDGAFAEYCAHPADMCYKLPDNVDTMEGALIEPLAVGFHAVSLAVARVGQSAVVLGCGCIGLVTIMALRACGVREIYAADTIEKRLAKAEELGAEPFLVGSRDLAAFAAGIGGVDHVFETAGNETTTLQTAKLVKKAGTVTLVGMTARPEITYDVGSLMEKEATLHTVFRYRNLYPTAIAAVSSGSVPLKSIVSDVCPFDELPEALERNLNNKNNVIKMVIKF